MQKIIDWLKHNAIYVIAAALALAAVAISAIGIYMERQQKQAEQQKSAVVTQEQTRDAKALQRQLDISRANVDALQKRLTEAQAGQRAPTTTYYVSAPTVERAAQVVERQIREDAPTLPRAAREQTDRTVVTPITKNKDGKDLPAEQQKVDVYKINLRKDHRIKAGASVIDGKALMSVGYEQGRFEALAHFDGTHYKGMTVMYNVVEW